MGLENQFKVIFYSFIYGMFFLVTLRLMKLIKIRKKILKIIIEFFFCFIHVIIFYFLLYKINYGSLNYYMIIFLILGGLFCQLLYFKDNNHF